VSNLLLPAKSVLAEDLGLGLKGLAALGEDASAEDDGVGAGDCLVVVDVGGAVGAVVAVYVVARVTLVGVALNCVGALGDLEVGLGNDLVEGEGTAGEDLAGVAVAENVALLFLVKGGGPLSSAAVADSVERRHVD